MPPRPLCDGGEVKDNPGRVRAGLQDTSEQSAQAPANVDNPGCRRETADRKQAGCRLAGEIDHVRVESPRERRIPREVLEETMSEHMAEGRLSGLHGLQQPIAGDPEYLPLQDHLVSQRIGGVGPQQAPERRQTEATVCFVRQDAQARQRPQHGVQRAGVRPACSSQDAALLRPPRSASARSSFAAT